jgi:hypothetical protein
MVPAAPQSHLQGGSRRLKGTAFYPGPEQCVLVLLLLLWLSFSLSPAVPVSDQWKPNMEWSPAALS